MKVLHELEKRDISDEKPPDMVKRILVSHYSVSLTTSSEGRRSTCVEYYRQDALARLDVSA